MALKAWGVLAVVVSPCARCAHHFSFPDRGLCFATWKFLKVTVWPASESSTIKLVNYGNYLGTGTVSDCWRSSPSFGQSLEGCAALLRLSWHLGDWPGVGEPWLLAGDEVWGNLGRGTRKLHTCGVAMDTVGHCAKVIQRNAQFRVQIDYCSFFWANLVISPGQVDIQQKNQLTKQDFLASWPFALCSRCVNPKRSTEIGFHFGG